ncbi:hypothetical protein HYX10_04165 [Candidatus Woesearchaeota archaeon]|nr:hypothetical protein [Candidatus Woesearchaeota archaeon]
MGFLNFLSKKKGKSSDIADMPLPPPNIRGDEGLPSFPEESEGEELKLPDLGELDEPEMPPEPSEKPFEPMPRRMSSIPPVEPLSMTREMPKPMQFPEMPVQKEEFIQPAEHREEPYKHTPAAPKLFRKPQIHTELLPEEMPKPMQFPEMPEPYHEPQHNAFMRQKDGAFIRGESYRELMQEISTILTREKDESKETSAERIEERQHDAFIKTIEELQAKLMEADDKLFGGWEK